MIGTFAGLLIGLLAGLLARPLLDAYLGWRVARMHAAELLEEEERAQIS